MAARNRPRAGPMKDDSADAHEERNMWNQIVHDLKRLKTIQTRATEVSKAIIDMEGRMAEPPSLVQIDDLQHLYKEALKLAEEEIKILDEEPSDVIKNVGILTALRTASEIEPRNNSQSKSRNPKRQKLDTDGTVDSPGPSPGAPISAAKVKATTVRAGSVPIVKEPKELKEPVVKAEEGSEGVKGPSAERAGKFFIGAEVAYRLAKAKEDPQWIQCEIINIDTAGNKKRYEVQDPEPDDNGQPGQIYKASAAALIAIPSPETPLPDYPVGKQVLARYPETTTFYRAIVTGVKKDVYRLKFEDDNENEMEVTRSTAHVRKFAAFLSLVTGLLLTNHAFQYLSRTDVHESQSSSDGASKFTRVVTVQRGSQESRTYSLSLLHRQPRVKRALSAQVQCLVQKGKEYWEQGVLPAFDGQFRFPTPNFGDAEDKLADSGWKKYDDPQALPSYWQEVFGSTPGGVPTESLVKLELDQSREFTNAFGDQATTFGNHQAMYLPQSDAILSILSNSPLFKLSHSGVPAKDIAKKLPRMNQRSDLLWFMWDSKTDHPERLRYFAMDGITNDVTRPLIKEILNTHRGTQQVPWAERATFDLNSDEGKALLASPNGLSVNWFLIHHAAVLGRREPRVTIFNAKGGDPRGERFCMIWDLIPQGQEGSFGKVEEEPKQGQKSGSRRRRTV
ncbi:MAG: hypothetical protein Q9221_007148 [Calogaya cf. arnoldii]